MAQDPNTPQNTVSPADPGVSVVPSAGVASDPIGNSAIVSPDPSAQTNVVAAHEVEVEGDVQAVPQEGVGLDSSGETQSAPVVAPVLPEQPLPPQEAVVPDIAPESVPPVASGGDDDQSAPVPPSEPVLSDSTATITSPSTETPAEGGDGEKSPLDILEEILAGAEAEKKQVDEEKQKKEAEEAEFQAQLQAKQAEYQVQAEQRLQESQSVVEEAKQQREDVDKQLLEQGKIDQQSTSQGDEFAIHQLEHQKPE